MTVIVIVVAIGREMSTGEGLLRVRVRVGVIVSMKARSGRRHVTPLAKARERGTTKHTETEGSD